MSERAFDQKNQDDFTEYTKVLNDALLEIQKNKDLKATVAQLSAMTGVHRNTITNRGWPVEKLKAIKEARKVAEEKIEEEDVDKRALLESQLTEARKEVVYWFNQYQDMKSFFEHSDKRFRQMRESRDHYKSLYEADKKSLLAAEEELDRLKDLLELKY